MSTVNPYLKMEGLTKTFGKVIANNDVNFNVQKGEIHALLGENGAGKSTLMNMLSGIYTPDSGSIFIRGKKADFTSPKDAINAGIGMIHQHFKLVELFTAKENIILGKKAGLFINQKNLTKDIKEVSQKFKLDIDPDKKVYDMSIGEKQTLEILKVLYRGADILILDEPTAVLTPQETKRLFKIIKRMTEQGCAVVFISHKMNEVMEIADRITVLRKGQTIATLEKDKTNPKELTDLMVGRSVDLSIKRLETEKKDIVLKVKNLKAVNEDGVQVLKGLNFDIYSGEILGVAGIAGSGQKELCESIAGLFPVSEGEILFKNENLVGKNPREIITKGVSMSFIPEDRLGMGLVASMNMVDNLILKQYQSQKGFLIDRKPAEAKSREIVEKLDVQTPGIFHPIRDLSGGNIQKVLLGRELDSNPELLITAYPVRGLDINTCHKIYDLLNEEKKKGVAVLFIAEDLDVLIELSDRVMVLYNGEITGIIDAKIATKEEVGLLMVGEKSQKTEGADIV